MKRREFLKWAASIGAGLAVSQVPWVKRWIQPRPIEPRLTDYVESIKVSACALCPQGCSIRLRLLNGFPVTVQGNPEDPRTGGGLCPKGLAMLQQFYHPDRLKKPLKRTGPRGTNQWQVVEWDEALDALAEKLRSQIKRNPKGLVFLNGRPFGLMNKLIDHWMHTVGSPNHLADHYQNALPLAAWMMLGAPFQAGYRLDEIDYLVSVGDAFLDFTAHPVARIHQYARFRESEGTPRGYLVLFDDQRGITAEKADEFHRIEPGTYAAVLLALANVVVRYELYDGDLVRHRASGFEDWKRQVLLKYSPESVEPMTGVPASVLYDTAIRLARTEKKLVIAGIPALSGPGGIYTAMALLALNFILGNIDRFLHFQSPLEDEIYPGKVFPPELSVPDRLGSDQFPLALSAPWAIPDRIQDDLSAVETIFLYYSNPVATHPDGERWVKALESIDTIVSFSPFLDETSQYADWILPDSHFLERYQDLIPAPLDLPAMTISQPFADEPMFDTRPTGDVLLDLIRRVDPDLEDEFPWETYQDLLEEAMVRLYMRESGTLFRPPSEYAAFIELARRGYWESPYADEDEFIEAFYEKGGWVQPIYVAEQWGRIFRTRSGRFEFASTQMYSLVEKFMMEQDRDWKDLGLEGREKTFSMPEYLPLAGKPPIGKLTYLLTWNTGGTGELPWWWEVIGMHRYIQWSIWAELGTGDPELGRMDLPRRHEVTVEIRGRKWTLPLVYRHLGHSGVLVIPVGFGRDIDRRTPLPRGWNVLRAVPYIPDPLTGIPGFYFPVKILNLVEVSAR